METEAIRSGFDNLMDGREYDALYHSAPVSYTHLDVYKRQATDSGNPSEKTMDGFVEVTEQMELPF